MSDIPLPDRKEVVKLLHTLVLLLPGAVFKYFRTYGQEWGYDITVYPNSREEVGTWRTALSGTGIFVDPANYETCFAVPIVSDDYLDKLNWSRGPFNANMESIT